MIAISSVTFDPAGYVRLRDLPSSDVDTVTRRVMRARTLDGNAEVTDRGFTHADRDFRVEWESRSEVEYLKVQRMFRLYSELLLMNREGVFRVAPVQLTREERTARLEVMVKEKVG